MPKKILLADDSVTIQKVVELTFAEGDYEVTCVSNGKAAIEKLQASRPDIMLCDIIMPEVSGYDVAQFVKRNPVYSAIPVILLTGTFEPFDEEKARLSGADTYITKPFDSRMLVEKVESLLQKRLVMDTTLPAPAFEVMARQEMTVRPQEAESPFAPVEPAPQAFQAAQQPPAEQAFEAAFEPAVTQTPARPPAASGGAAFEAATIQADSSAAASFEPAEHAVFEAAAFEPEPQAAAPEPPVSVPAPVQEQQLEAAFESEPQAVTAVPPAPDRAPVEPFEPVHAAEPVQYAAAVETPPGAPQVMDVAMLGTQPVPESVFEGLAEAPPQAVSEEAPALEQPAGPSPEARLASAPVVAGEEVALPETPATPAAEAFLDESEIEEEKEQPAPRAHLSVSGPKAPEAVSERLPPFAEEPGGEPEIESAAWLQAEEPAPPSVEPADGIVHDMSEQQEMVAEAQKVEPPAPPAETVLDEAAMPDRSFWDDKIDQQPVSEESTIDAAQLPIPDDTNPSEVMEHEAAVAKPAVSEVPVERVTVTAEQVEAIVRKILEEMAPEILRQVAWEVIPELAENLIKRRIQELESQAE